MLRSLWLALEKEDDSASESIVGLVTGLDDLVSKWDEECKKSVPADQTSTDEKRYDHLIKDFIIRLVSVSPAYYFFWSIDKCVSSCLPFLDHSTLTSISFRCRRCLNLRMRLRT